MANNAKKFVLFVLFARFALEFPRDFYHHLFPVLPGWDCHRHLDAQSVSA
jgi:hypothetical protein